MKRILALIVVFMVIVGCSDSTIEKVDPSANSADASSQEQKQEQKGEEPVSNAPEIFVVGDTVKFDDLHITLHGVTEVEGAEFFTPSNDKYLLVDLIIENVGAESEHISTLMQMELMDADSYSYDIALYPDAKGSLDGEVAPGRKMRGEVAFDVPDSDYYEFIFSNPFTSGQAIWRIERGDIGQ